jgi:hypothetical protein
MLGTLRFRASPDIAQPTTRNWSLLWHCNKRCPFTAFSNIVRAVVQCSSWLRDRLIVVLSSPRDCFHSPIVPDLT